MSEEGKLVNQAADLRRRAEAKDRENIETVPEKIDHLSPKEIQQILHDLRVHQIELEMQNEELRRTQVELDGALAEYFNLYDLAPVGDCTINDKGLLIKANLTIAGLLGLARSALVGQRLSSFIHQKDQDTYYLHFKQLIATGATQLFELRLKKSDGSVFWAQLVATIWQDSSVLPTFRITVNNIKQRTETLMRLNKIFALTRDLIAYVDTDYTCRMVNQRFCEVYDIKLEEAIGRTVAEELGDEYFTKIVKPHLDRCLNGETTKYYSWFEYKKIGLRYREVTHYPDQDAEGRIKGAFVMIHDLTELKEMEIALQSQNEQLLTLINSLPDFINFKDDRGNWLLANDRMLRLFEFGHIDYTGKSDAELAESSNLYQGVVKRFVETDEVAWANKRITQFIEQIEWPDGVKCTFEILKNPLFHDDGTRKGLVVIGRDITDSVIAAKDLEEKNIKIKETNIALKVLVDHEKGKSHVIEKRIQATIKRLVFPYIEELSKTEMNEKGQEHVQQIRAHLSALSDSFCHRLNDLSILLTPKELLVADLVRQGKSSKTIAKLLGLTERTVEVYRNAIRKKLKINGQKKNLKTFLKETFTS